LHIDAKAGISTLTNSWRYAQRYEAERSLSDALQPLHGRSVADTIRAQFPILGIVDNTAVTSIADAINNHIVEPRFAPTNIRLTPKQTFVDSPCQ
jgi:hypothetical protein